MERGPPAAGAENSASPWDRLPAIGSSLPPLPPRAPATLGAESSLFAALMSPAEPDHGAPLLDALKDGDPATTQQRIPHVTSQINAECFIALLKMMDPMPEDYRARAEYEKLYRKLHEVLTIPPPAGWKPADPLR